MSNLQHVYFPLLGSCELVPTAYWMSCYRPSEQRRTKQKLSWDMQSFTVSLSLIRRYSPWFIDSADVADSLLKAGLLKTLDTLL